MKTRTLRSMFASLLTLAVVAFSATAVRAQNLPPLVPYGGFFNQQAQIATRVKMLPTKDTVTQIGTINMRQVLAQAWNSNRPLHGATIRNFMIQKLGLHDVSVKLVPANIVPGAKDVALIMYVDPSKKTLTLVHRISRHSMQGTLAIPWNFDPTIVGTYDLDLTVFMTSTGGPGAPMVYTGSRITVANFKHNILDLALNGAAVGFEKAVFADAGSGKLAVSNLNSVLAPAVAATHLPLVTPGMRVGYNTFNLVFELSRQFPPLVVSR